MGALIFVVFIITLVSVALGVSLFAKEQYKFWKRKGVPMLKPTFPFGDLQNFLTRKVNRMEEFVTLYKTAKAKGFKKICGIYQLTVPTLLVLDLDLIRDICVKDFEHFVDRGFYYNEKDDPLSVHLLSIEGDRWKYARKKISTVFTSSKLKWMFKNMKNSADSFVQFIEQGIQNGNKTLNIRDLVSLFIADSVGSSTLGIECNSLADPDKNFVKNGHAVLDLSRMAQLFMFFGQYYPKLSRKLRIKQLSTDVSEFFRGTIKNAIDQRRKSNVERPDILQLLMNLEEKEKSFTPNEIISYSFGMYVGALETSSSSLSFALYYLAKHKQYQDKVRKEVKQVMKNFNNEFSYEAVQELKFLQQCINETLRLHPSVLVINRVCTKSYKIPGEDVVLEKGSTISITLTGIHKDPEYYERPDEFYPDHFSEENVRNRHPYAYLPFGEGPRQCVGRRYGKLQITTTIACLISKFIVTVDERTREPLEFAPAALVPLAKGIYLNFEKVTN